MIQVRTNELWDTLPCYWLLNPACQFIVGSRQESSDDIEGDIEFTQIKRMELRTLMGKIYQDQITDLESHSC